MIQPQPAKDNAFDSVFGRRLGPKSILAAQLLRQPHFTEVELKQSVDADPAERWSADAGDADRVQLEIPADLHRERRFEVSFSMTVSAQRDAAAPWHELRVEADGKLLWSRRVGTQCPGEFDGLDYRFRATVPPGQPLRLLALSRCAQARRISLRVDAEEC